MTFRDTLAVDDPVTLGLRATYMAAQQEERAARQVLRDAERTVRRCMHDTDPQLHISRRAQVQAARRAYAEAIECRHVAQRAMHEHIRVRVARAHTRRHT